MTERGKRLLERDGQGWSAVLNHPLQQAARNNIEQLLSGLRACRTEADLDDFQRALFQQVVDAQTLQAKASRNVKRVRYGRPVPRSPSGDWVIDRWVADRVVRQLRSVGDALAWRMFGFDRRYLLALSRNAGPPGPFVDGIDADGEPRFKAGLERELGVVVDRWNEQRQFSLLCDLTNSIRICDVIGFSPTGPRLIGSNQVRPANGATSSHEPNMLSASSTKERRLRVGPAGRMLISSRAPCRSRLSFQRCAPCWTGPLVSRTPP